MCDIHFPRKEDLEHWCTKMIGCVQVILLCLPSDHLLRSQKLLSTILNCPENWGMWQPVVPLLLCACPVTEVISVGVIHLWYVGIYEAGLSTWLCQAAYIVISWNCWLQWGFLKVKWYLAWNRLLEHFHY